MNDVGVLEAHLRIALDRSPSTSLQDIQTSILNINQFCSSVEGLIFFINNYFRFQYTASRKFVFILCKNWSLYRWAEISEEQKTLLKTLLFIRSIENFDQVPQDFHFLIGDAQVAFMWNSFPNEWPHFWSDFLKLPQSVVLNFLYAFCSLTSTMTQDSNATFVQIKQTIRGQNIDNAILDFLFDSLASSNFGPLPLKALASLIHWVSLDYILNNNTMSIIINSLSNPAMTSSAIDVLTSLIERGMDSSMKIQIIDSLQIPPRVIGLICSNADNTILYSAAQLIENTGSFLLTTPKALPFFQISLQLLTNEDNEISGCVAPFVQQYTKSYPDVAPIVMNTCYSRIKDYYNFIEVEDEAFCEMLFGIIRSCFMVNHDDSLQFLLSICESMDIIEEIPHCIALIEILNDQQPQPEFVQYFKPLLSLVPPLSNHQTKALGCYVRFFTSVAGVFDAATISTFFARIAEFALSPTIIEETRSILSFSLLGFAKKYNNIIFDQTLIFNFVQTIDPNLISIAALLISRLEQNQFDIFKSCVSHLFSKLQADPHLCPLVLQFIRTMHYVQGAPHISIVLDFLKQISQYVRTIDQLQALFIRTCFSSLGPESYELINECIPTSTERLSICALSEVSNAISKLSSNIDFSVNMANHMLDSFIVCFNEIDDWSIVNDNTVEVIQMVDNYLALSRSVVAHSSPEFVQKLFGFVVNALSSKYFCYQLYCHIYSFISHVAKINPLQSLQAFGQLTLTALLSNTCFQPAHPGWDKVITKLAKFHSHLLSACPDTAISMIASTLTQANANETMIQSYLAIFQLSPRLRNEGCITFFNDFKKYQKSLC